MRRRDPLERHKWPPRFRWNPERGWWEIRSLSEFDGARWRPSIALRGQGREAGLRMLRGLVAREGWMLKVVSYRATWAEQTCDL